MAAQRLTNLIRFYSLLDALQSNIGGVRRLEACSGRMKWPARGVYFFFESGEVRSDTGVGPRIVRVGTHALKQGSKTKLWSRLSQHRGQLSSGGGNHRGSIFRLIIGTSLIRSTGRPCHTWGKGNSATSQITAGELALECEVSKTIGAMPFLWLSIADEAGPSSLSGYVERNAIALISNSKKVPLDPPSDAWLGFHCDRERVRTSGLWNSNHVDEPYDQTHLPERGVWLPGDHG